MHRITGRLSTHVGAKACTLILMFALAWSSPAAAQSIWTNNSGAGNAQWSTGSNWNTAEPDAVTSAIFPSPIPTAGQIVTLSNGELANDVFLDDAYTFNGGQLDVRNGNITVATGITANINSNLNGIAGLTKLGAGTMILGVANTYTGLGEINEGTLKLGIDNSLPTGEALNIGAGATAGSFDLGSFNQTVGSLNFRSTDAAVTNTVNIGAGKTLLVNGTGSLTLGIPTPFVNGMTTKATVSGAGTLNINNAVAGSNLNVGYRNVDQGQTTNSATLDLTGLGNFIANVAELRNGYDSKIGATLLLSNTANTITATTIHVGNSLSNNGTASFLTLGTGTNAINTNTLNIGLGKTGGTVAFASQAAASPGSLVLGGKTVAEVDINIGVNTVVNTSALFTGLLDLRGHSATVTADSVNLGQWNQGASAGGSTGTIHFDTGTFTANSVKLGTKTGTGTGTVNGNLNIGGGTFTLKAGGSFTLAAQSSSGVNATANGLLNLTGGTLVSNVSILDGGGSNSNSTVTIDGGTLDLNGNSLGDATNAINTLNFRSGTLQDVGQINNGAALVKTTAGTLILAGLNTHTGATTVAAGTLLVNGTHTGGGVYTVQPLSILGGTGTIGASVIVDNGAILAPGASIESLAVSGDLNLNGELNIEIDPAGAGASDIVNVAGQLALGGTSTLAVSILNVTLDDAAYVIASYGSWNAVPFSNVSMPAGYTVDYNYQNANQIALVATVAVPEPATLVLAGLGMVGLIVLKRRGRMYQR